MIKRHEALLASLGTIDSEIALAGFLRDLAGFFDFKAFLVVDIPAVADTQLQPRIVLSDLPAGFMETYDAIGLVKSSPAFDSLRRSTIPVSWTPDTINIGRPSPEADLALELFARHSLTIGVYFPVHSAAGERAAVGFLGDRPNLDHTEMGELGIYVMHVYDKYSGLKGNTTQTSGNSLTPRELEVLHWVANGKTSAEIGAIVSLSDHTVNAYLNSAMRKLDCVNRTQLVAKAFRLHIIC
ncbi:LuxR C-terminal-related transcriptional regulator [Hoeflea sp. YIM 152468]|uniref:helix-turn-helix transcriptional regulator n=1 Tax=Hoeflea sp. YIM 152468 TaxID=3031759 RepID=UPI0023DBC27B|nr:LuxR family transcriptional regulator [Hoeflea sp. YIM 152468]MDF1609750.1 LuxR C-terminal-related transcriptional regulator [Hoeflea sp. YIM 152468]